MHTLLLQELKTSAGQKPEASCVQELISLHKSISSEDQEKMHRSIGLLGEQKEKNRDEGQPLMEPIP